MCNTGKEQQQAGRGLQYTGFAFHLLREEHNTPDLPAPLPSQTQLDGTTQSTQRFLCTVSPPTSRSIFLTHSTPLAHFGRLFFCSFVIIINT